MPSYEMFPSIFMGVEMIVFENSVMEMYLLNTHLSFHINSFYINKRHLGEEMENGIPPWQMQCPNNKQETKSNQIQLQSTWTHLRIR